MTANVIIEPRLQSGSVSPAGTDAGTLPPDLQHEQSLRLQLLYATGTILWLLTFAMDLWVAPHGSRSPALLKLSLIGAACAAVSAALMRFTALPHRRKVDIGTFAVIPHALIVALVNSAAPQPTTSRPLSAITMLILFVGMLAPARPSKVLLAGVVAAAMDPLAVWIAHLRGLPVPSPLLAVLLYYENFVCAVVAVVPTVVVYSLGRRIRQARELGSYRLIERLGAGGMGEVWLARHRLLARTAAIKLIRPEVLSGGGTDQIALAVARFEREARATAALTSPHTIRLYDYGVTENGACYYVMERLDGRDLHSLVREFGPLPPARVLYLLRQLCASLAEAHAAGVIHRDITPANVYVCRLGLEYDFVKVLDFGLARREDSTAGTTMLTRQASLVGTPAYLAPEAIVGDPVDRRADVYALGCVAYFMLTGQPVFGESPAMAQLVKHVQDAPAPPSTRSPHRVPRALDELVLACLQKQPAARPDDAEILGDMVAACFTRDTWDGASARLWWERHVPAVALEPWHEPSPSLAVPA